MASPSATDSDQVAALAAALKEHLGWLAASTNGRGVDRHLMGLRITAAMAGGGTPPLFRDPAYERTSTYALSSSNNSSPGLGGEYFEMGGFGAPLVDCYGVAYQIQDHAIACTVSSDARCAGRCASRFATVVEGALTDVFSLATAHGVEIGAALQAKPTSKL